MGVARVGPPPAPSLLKAGAFAAIALALSMPRVTVYQSKVAVGILVDTSASVSNADLQAESSYADRVERSRGGNWSHVMPFARTTRAAAQDERPKNRLGAAAYRGRRRPRHQS